MGYKRLRKLYESSPGAVKQLVGCVPFGLLAGRHYREVMALEKVIDRAGRDQLVAYQGRALGQALAFACDQVPAYAHLRSTVERLPPFEAIKAFPLVDKEDLHATCRADLPRDFDTEMSPYPDRVTVDGPTLMLSSQAAQNFALAVHELATNAAKYGALSNQAGWVHISWSVLQPNGDSQFSFRWQEFGGPPVEPPTIKGFGAVVLEQVMAEYFAVSPKIEFAPGGVCYELKGPVEAVVMKLH